MPRNSLSNSRALRAAPLGPGPEGAARYILSQLSRVINNKIFQCNDGRNSPLLRRSAAPVGLGGLFKFSSYGHCSLRHTRDCRWTWISFVIVLVARASDIQSFRCKARPLPVRRRKGLQRSISRTFYSNNRCYGGPARGQCDRVTPLSNITRTEKNLNIKILHKCSGFVSGPSEHSLREPSSACILRIEELLPEALPVNLPGPLSRRWFGGRRVWTRVTKPWSWLPPRSLPESRLG